MPEVNIDPVAFLKSLDEKRADLNSRHARMNLLAEQATVELKKVDQEMTALNTTPATLETDIKKGEEEEQSRLRKYAEDLAGYEQKLVEAEQAIQPPS